MFDRIRDKQQSWTENSTIFQFRSRNGWVSAGATPYFRLIQYLFAHQLPNCHHNSHKIYAMLHSARKAHHHFTYRAGYLKEQLHARIVS